MNLRNPAIGADSDEVYREIVVWGDSYATGIELVDNQHKELVVMTNNLYHACLAVDNAVEPAFKEVMTKMVEYVRVHFSTEQILLEKIGYPDFQEHRKQHDGLIRNILLAAKEYDQGKKFVPHNFVRTLRDWIFGHIACFDQRYAVYVREQLKKGSLNRSQFG